MLEVSRAGAGLKSAGSGRARALHCGLGLLRAWPGLGGGLGVWPAGLAQKPGLHGLGKRPAPAIEVSTHKGACSPCNTRPEASFTMHTYIHVCTFVGDFSLQPCGFSCHLCNVLHVLQYQQDFKAWKLMIYTII
jgi:hypothetical protein